MKNNIAKIIRILSIPPIMISALVLILANSRADVFHDGKELLIILLLLGLVPLLAYPFQHMFPSLLKKGRDEQRKLAFIFTLVGYTSAFLYSIISSASNELIQITLTYFLSVVLLTFVNKVLKFKASGHACSFAAPMFFLSYYVSYWLIIPCILAAMAIGWSSVYLKRHTRSQLIGGIIVCIISFCLTILIL